jgi:TonB-linked SusC/RagA family outer membrane protein
MKKNKIFQELWNRSFKKNLLISGISLILISVSPIRGLAAEYDPASGKLEGRETLADKDTPGNPEAQPVSVSGTITDESGAPLTGVTILVKGTTTGAVTDLTGSYTLNNVPENATLVFSFVGMISQEIPLNGRSRIDVIMQEEAVGLEELVVVGYGVQRKVNLTGAVEVISSDVLSNRQSPTVSQLLQGVSPGVTLSPGSNSFEPGESLGIQIRGMGSLNGGKPYILVDGFPGDIDKLNPEDIESISVLKDAAASAIYGARAPYGVVLVTTKKGKKGEKLTATYSGNVTIAKPQRLPEMLDSYTWVRILNEAGANRGGQTFSNATVDRIIAYQAQDWDYIKNSIPAWPEGATVFGAFPSGTLWNNANLNYANTDWVKFHYGSSVNQNHNFSLRGGSETADYYFSAGYLEQGTVLNYADNSFKRINILAKINMDITKWWNFSYEANLADRNLIKPSRGISYINVFRAYPISPVFDGWGNYQYNSFVPDMRSGDNKSKELDQWHSFRTELNPLKGWKINADFSYNTLSGNGSAAYNIVYDYRVDNTGKIARSNSVPNRIEKTHTNNYYWTSNVFTSYELNLNDDHNFFIMGGMQLEYGRNNWLFVSKSDLITENVPSLETSIGSPIASESVTQRATEGFFGRFSYNYKEKYLIESNVRYDGSYVFRSGNRWGFFPSFSAGWNVHKEAFWSGISQYVNSMKVRASWGQLGNQNVNPFTDLELVAIESGKLNYIFNYGTTKPIGYTTAPGIVNKNLTWETATTANAGVNMTFLNNRLQLDFDAFERTTTNMVGPSEAKPGVLGANVPQANNATLRTRGWELGLRWKQDLKNGISYFINGNLFDDRSVVTKYYNTTGTLTTWYEGKEAGEIWGYTVNDLFRTQQELDDYRAEVDLSKISVNWKTGDVRYEDTDGDGEVSNGANTIYDPGDMSIIGNSNPHYQYGLSAGMSFKGLDFSMIWRGVAKRQQYFDYWSNLYWGFSRQWFYSHHSEEHLDYFRDQPGTKYVGLYEGDANINLDAWYPRPYENVAEQTKNLNYPNTRYLANAAYLRMQNIQLGYTLPGSIVSKLKLAQLRVYFSGENLLTFTDLPLGMDPVAPTDGRLTYGADRMFSFGLTITY